MPRRIVSAFPWPMQLVQAAAKGFDLVLVGDLLAFGQLQRFQHLLHVVQCSAERLNNLVDVLDRLLNGRR